MAAQQEARQSVTLVVMRIGAAQTSQNVVGSISHLLRPPPFLQCSRKRRQSDCFIIGTTKGGRGGEVTSQCQITQVRSEFLRH